jgi:hypothetical protein
MNNSYNSNPVLSNEPKGVLLGIILFVCRHLTKMSKLVIQINLFNYVQPLAKLFVNIKWIGPNDTTKPDFTICIGSNILGDLNINMIDSIYSDNQTNKYFNAKKIYLLPFYNPDNPLIMWAKNKTKEQSVQKLKTQIIKFSANKANANWDIQTQQKILELYFSKTNVFVSKPKLFNWFDTLYAQTIIKKKKQIGSLPIPNYMPNFIPIIFSTGYKQQIEQIKEMIEKKSNKYNNLVDQGLGLGLGLGFNLSQGENQVETPIKKEALPEPDDNLNLKKEINDLKKIIELLNENIQALEANNTSALSYQTDFGIQGGGGRFPSKPSKETSKLVKLRNQVLDLKYKLLKNQTHKI